MIGQILIAVALVVTAQILLKQGVSTLGALEKDHLRHPVRFALRLARIPSIVLGLLLYAISAAAWIVVLSRAPLSYAFPFLGLSYVGVTFVAVVYLRERFSPVQWAGLAFVLAGVLLVAGSA